MKQEDPKLNYLESLEINRLLEDKLDPNIVLSF